jgi:hypothetical protein
MSGPCRGEELEFGNLRAQDDGHDHLSWNREREMRSEKAFMLVNPPRAVNPGSPGEGMRKPDPASRVRNDRSGSGRGSRRAPLRPSMK